MASEIRRLAHIRAELLDEFNDWADKRDDALIASDARKARYVARHIEAAVDKLDKAIALLRQEVTA
ncbi:hypothetical protein [Sphingomonas phage Kimi]|nr:hypothetical protein [Sphingomonas phage Kimi]